MIKLISSEDFKNMSDEDFENMIKSSETSPIYIINDNKIQNVLMGIDLYNDFYSENPSDKVKKIMDDYKILKKIINKE